ncbi:MAG: tripartite tricarboxylate transporter TctB family protein, partial [Thermodesulfobacteriota bacterium]
FGAAGWRLLPRAAPVPRGGTMKKGEILFSALCLAFFSFMFYEAMKLHGVGRFGEVGSGFWPMLALGASVLLSLCWLIVTVGKSFREKGSAEETSQETIEAAWRRRRKVALAMVCILAYISVMPWIGFVLSTFLFIPAFAVALEERRKWVLILSPILVTAATVLIFARFISIAFPKGEGLFADFSRFFY